MLSLPKWVFRIFAESVCAHCEKDKIRSSLKPEGVFAQGIREEMSKKTKKMRLSYYYEYKCDICGKPSRFSGFPTNMHDFIADMIEVSNSPQQDTTLATEDVKKPSKPVKSEAQKNADGKEKIKIDGISDTEFESFKKLMSETMYFEDLLDKIGITKEERERLKEAYKDE